MRSIQALAAISVALLTFGLAPASAQELERSAVISACAGANASGPKCDAALEAYIDALAGLPSSESDALLADLVYELALSATPATRAIIGSAILVAAQAMDDRVRAAAAVEIGSEVTAGSFGVEVVDALGSPN